MKSSSAGWGDDKSEARTRGSADNGWAMIGYYSIKAGPVSGTRHASKIGSAGWSLINYPGKEVDKKNRLNTSKYLATRLVFYGI